MTEESERKKEKESEKRKSGLKKISVAVLSIVAIILRIRKNHKDNA